MNLVGFGTNNCITTSDGDYSWLVTIQPDLMQTFGGGGWPTSGQFYGGDASKVRQFYVSVVVFQKRPLAPVVVGAAAPGVINTMQDLNRGERMVWVDFIGRGAVRLRTNSPLVTTLDSATKYLSVDANQWFMVTGRRQSNVPNPYMGNPYQNGSPTPWMETSLHWYHVIATTNLPQSYNNQWYVDAVVDGDDWTLNGAMGQSSFLYNDENSFGYTDYGETPTGIGTIMTGAISVYSKMITQDTNSLWTEH